MYGQYFRHPIFFRIKIIRKQSSNKLFYKKSIFHFQYQNYFTPCFCHTTERNGHRFNLSTCTSIFSLSGICPNVELGYLNHLLYLFRFISSISNLLLDLFKFFGRISEKMYGIFSLNIVSGFFFVLLLQEASKRLKQLFNKALKQG